MASVPSGDGCRFPTVSGFCSNSIEPGSASRRPGRFIAHRKRGQGTLFGRVPWLLFSPVRGQLPDDQAERHDREYPGGDIPDAAVWRRVPGPIDDRVDARLQLVIGLEPAARPAVEHLEDEPAHRRRRVRGQIQGGRVLLRRSTTSTDASPGNGSVPATMKNSVQPSE